MHFQFPSARQLGILVVCLLMLFPMLRPVSAQEGPPKQPGQNPLILPELTSSDDDAALLRAFQASALELNALTPSVVDAFGYGLATSINSPSDVTFNWIDAFGQTAVSQPGCQKLGITGSEMFEKIEFGVGRSFPFYEHNYTEVFANTEGYLSFGSGSFNFVNTPLPLRAVPNNLVAAFWDDLSIDPARDPQSGVYICQTAEYLVVEWHRAILYQAEDQGTATFEAILFWNGDVKVQYHSFGGDIANATTGIEDTRGLDGLQYQFNEAHKVGPGTAIFFQRPARSARVYAWPAYQGKFASYTDAETYETISFPVHLVNTGDKESPTTDTYTVTDISSPTGWQILSPALPYQVQINQGESKDFNVVVQPPASAGVGSYTTITLQIRSANDWAKTQQVFLQAAVPAPFVQSYWENASDRLVFSMIERARSEQIDVKLGVPNSGSPALMRRPIGYAYFWDEKRSVPGQNFEVNEILFSLTNLKGEPQSVDAQKLVDHGSPQQYILDSNMAVAVAPDGRIGVFWLRETGEKPELFVNNLYFAVLDHSGQFVSTPAVIPLTHNTTPNTPAYRELRITATSDSRFVLAWREQISTVSGTSNSIVYQVLNSNGSVLLAATKYRVGPAGSGDLFFAPTISGIRDNQFIMAWGRKLFDPASPEGGFYMTEYSVFDSRGEPLQNPQTVTGVDDGAGRADIVELFDGQVALAIPYGQVNLVMLEYDPQAGVYTQKDSPVAYSHPDCQTLDQRYVSLAATLDNQAVMTWTCYSLLADQNKDGISPYQYNLFYALVASDGTPVTPPQIFYSSVDEQDPILHINQHGYAASSHPSLKIGVVDLSLAVPESFQLAPGVLQTVPAYYANIGKLTGTNVVLTASVDSRLQITSIQPTPAQVNGNEIRWEFPSLGFLDSGDVKLRVVGSQTGQYTIHWNLSSDAESDYYKSDNSGLTTLHIAQYVPYYPRQFVYLPVTRR